MIRLYEVLGLLDNVTKSGNGWKASCPSHYDKTPSLSVSRGKAQEVIFKCFAGCAQDEIVTSLERKGKKQPCYIYEYQNQNKEYLGQVVRWWGKKFKQVDAAQFKYIPYNLPEVLIAIERGDLVLIPEGEHDVETLRAIGRTATCNSGGAGKWTKEHSEWLRGARVVIIADNDAPGYKDARLKRQSLWGIAASVHILRPIDGFKDVTEHLEAGRGLGSLIRDLPDTGENTSDWKKLKVECRGMEEREMPQMTVDKLIAPGCTLFSAGRKVGKSLLSLYISMQVVRGLPVFGELLTKKGPVLMLSGEDSEDLVMNRMQALLAPEIGCTYTYDEMNPRTRRTHYHVRRITDEAKERFRSDISAALELDMMMEEIFDRGFDLICGKDVPRIDEGLSDLISGWRKDNPRGALVVIDNYVRIRPLFKSNNIETQEYRMMSEIEDLSAKLGISIVLLCHDSKAKVEDFVVGVSGTGGATAPVSNIIALTYPKGSDRSDPVRVLQQASRVIESSGEFGVTMRRDELLAIDHGYVSQVSYTGAEEKIMDALRRKSPVTMTPSQIAKETDLKLNTVKGTCRRMVSRGLLSSANGFYSIRDKGHD